MAIPLPALNVQPPRPTDLLGQYGKLVALKNLIAQEPLIQGEIQGQQIRNQAGQIGNQQAQLQLQQQQRLMDALNGSLPASGQPVATSSQSSTAEPDLDALKQKLISAGPAGLQYVSTIGKIQQNEADLKKSQLANAETVSNGLGHLGQLWLDSKGDPNVINSSIALASSIGPEYAAPLAQVKQILARNPNAWKQLANQYVSFSAQQQQLNSQKMAAEARVAEANKPNEATLAIGAANGNAQDQKALGMLRQPNVSAIEMKSWLQQHPGKTPADFLAYQKTLVPQFSFNLQSGAVNTGTPPGTSGENVLKSISPGDAAIVKALDEGRISLPSSFALRTPYWQRILGYLSQYDPQFSEQRAQIRKAFTTGTDGRNIGNLNTATVHLAALFQAAQGLNNGTLKPGNAIYNAISESLGGAAPTNFAAVKNAVAGELANALKGQATDAEIHNISQGIQASHSPQQLQQAIKENMGLVKQKLETYRERYQQQIPGDSWSPVLPAASSVFQKYGIGSVPTATTGAAAAGSGNVISVKAPDGHTYHFATHAQADKFKKEAGIQ